MRARSLYLLLLVLLLVLLFLRPRAGEDDDDDLNFPPGGFVRDGAARDIESSSSSRVVVVVVVVVVALEKRRRKRGRERKRERERGESSYLYACESCVSVSLDYSKYFLYGVYVRTTTQRAARILTGKNESFPNKKKNTKTKTRAQKSFFAFFLLSSRIEEDCVPYLVSLLKQQSLSRYI